MAAAAALGTLRLQRRIVSIPGYSNHQLWFLQTALAAVDERLAFVPFHYEAKNQASRREFIIIMKIIN